MGLAKHLVRYAVIVGLVGTAVVVVAGPERTSALVTQMRSSVNSTIDGCIEDPVALRQQMRSLGAEYPERIAALGRDLAEVRAQIAQLHQEGEVSERVVSLAGADLDQLRAMIARAEEARQVSTGLGEATIVKVVFNDEALDLNAAYQKARSVQQVQEAYAQRAADIQRELGYLAQQEQRLVSLHNQLQQEYTDFQAQLWQMDRQVDTIARNERLIRIMEKRQRTLDESSRYHAGSLQNLASRFADIRARQEARLESLAASTNVNSYEQKAKVQIDADKARRSLEEPASAPVGKPGVIHITPGDLRQEPRPQAKPLAMK
jgi:DNA repair exonuclease SbcCD ATPase subunit